MRLAFALFVTQYALRAKGQTEYVDLDHPPSLEPVEDTIKYVFIVARGGSRVPIFEPFPKDVAHWKRGKGELLEHGKRLMTALGRSLYSRYGEAIRRSEIKARSVSSDSSPRANQSAMCVAAELFRDKGYSVNDGFSSVDKSEYALRAKGQTEYVDLDHPPSLEPVEDTIKYVFIVARGGSRVPIFEPFPKDVAHWKRGKGELLEHGKRLMTALGRSLYSRYGEAIRRSEIKARSVSSDSSPRANQSAMCVAAELFRDKGYSVNDGFSSVDKSEYALRAKGQTEYVDLDHPPSLEPVEDTIKYVFIVARGGSRVPIFEPFPKDVAHWKRGKGELLEHGKRLMTALGRSLYSRYGEAIRRSEIKARSVSSDSSPRANQSAMCVAAELFRDKGYSVNDGFSSVDKSEYALRAKGQTEYVDLDHPPSLEPVEDTIKYVFIVARGGSRVPIFEPFPKDVAHWKRGKGELLEHGKRLMTALGRSLYSRYGEAIRRSEIKARSVSSDSSPRANQSAMCVAAELFRDKGYSVNDGFSSVDKSEMISQADSKTCPGYTRERSRTHSWQQLHSDATVQDDDNDVYARMAEIKNLTGVQGVITKLDLMKIWDTLYMERVALRWETGQQAPSWAEDLMRWKDMGDETYDFVTGGDRYLTEDFTVGPFFHRVLQEFAASHDGLGVTLHVTHSLFLTAILGTLNLHMYKPHLGTTLIFELHQDNLVRVLLYQPLDWDRPGELHQAKGRSPLVTALQGLCHDWDFNAELAPFTCPLDKFRAKLPVLSPLEWKERCKEVG